MLVKYNKPNILNVCYPIGKVEKGKPNGTRIDVIVGGINKIADSDWKSIKDTVKFKYLLEEGHLEVVTEKDMKQEDAEKEKVAPELGAMKVDQAVATVKQCLNKVLLSKWEVEDDRKKVQKAIEGQLKKLELTADERAAMEG